MYAKRSRGLTLAMALTVLAAGSASPPAALAQQAGRSDMVTVNFCNRTSAKVYLALMYAETNTADWIVEGWKIIQGGSCFAFTARNDANIYDYAEDDTGGSWGGDFKLCIERPGPFRRINSSSYTCRTDLLVGFAKVEVKGLTSRTVNLNP